MICTFNKIILNQHRDNPYVLRSHGTLLYSTTEFIQTPSTAEQRINLCICSIMLVEVYVQNRFLKLGFQSKRKSKCVILLYIMKFPHNSICIIFYSLQQCVRVPVSQKLCQSNLFYYGSGGWGNTGFANLVSEKYNFQVGFCISLNNWNKIYLYIFYIVKGHFFSVNIFTSFVYFFPTRFWDFVISIFFRTFYILRFSLTHFWNTFWFFICILTVFTVLLPCKSLLLFCVTFYFILLLLGLNQVRKSSHTWRL